jgi:hypothetical protein
MVRQLETCSLEERAMALDRALHSHTFARSEQLKAFLRFICEAEALRPGAPLTEYVIGVEVLRRPEGYSPAEDSSVRTRAYELRQKLEHLYAKELLDEPIQITVPKGTYSPQFVRRSFARITDEITPAVPPEATKQRHFAFVEPLRLKPVALIAVVILSLILGSSATWFALKVPVQKSSPTADPVLAEAWGPLAAHDGTVVVCLATLLSLVAGPYGHEVYASRSYPAPEEAYPLFKQHRLLPADGRLGLTFTDNLLAVGTMNAALTVIKRLQSFGTPYQLLPERVATVSSLRGRNAILLGAPVDSEAISIAMRDVPLMVDYDPEIREFAIRDKTGGQWIVPKKGGNGDFLEVYGLVTVKTARDMDSRSVQTVVLSGITSVGTQGAAEFFSSSSGMRSLRTAFAKEGINEFPAVYQVVVKCSYSNQLILSAEYHSHRVVRLSS